MLAIDANIDTSAASTLRVRGPKEEWVDSKCPKCGKYYFGAAIGHAQALHDKHEAGRCDGVLLILVEED